MRSVSSRVLAAGAALAITGVAVLGASTAALATPGPTGVVVTHTNPSAGAGDTLTFSATRSPDCTVVGSYGRAFVYSSEQTWEWAAPEPIDIDLVSQATTTFSVPAIGAGNSIRVLVMTNLDCDGEERSGDVFFTAPAAEEEPPAEEPPAEEPAVPAIDLTLDEVGSFGSPNPYEPFSFLLTATDWDSYECVVFPPSVTWTSGFTALGTGFPIEVTNSGAFGEPEFDGSTQYFRHTQTALGAFGSYTFSAQATGGCLEGTVLSDSTTFSMSSVPDGWTPPPTGDPSGDPEPDPSGEPTDEPTETPRDLGLTLDLAIGSQVEGAPGTATAEGLEEGADYDLVVRSTPQTLAVGAVPVGGVVTRTVTLPQLEAGWHSLTFTSTWASGGAAIARVWFQVSATGTLLATSSTAPALANTGSTNTGSTMFLGSLALAAGLALLAWRGRRTGPLAEPLFR